MTGEGGGGWLKDRDEGCCQLKVSLLGLRWEDHRKWSSVEVNGLLTHQDRRPAMCVCVYVCVCVCVRTSCHFDGCFLLMWLIRVTITACCIHQPCCNWFICSATLTVASSSKTWPVVLRMMVWWWIRLKHISMMRSTIKHISGGLPCPFFYIYILLLGVSIVHFWSWAFSFFSFQCVADFLLLVGF